MLQSTATGDASSSGEQAVTLMPSFMHNQWARSAAGVALGLLLTCGGLRVGEAPSVPSGLRPVIQFVRSAACVLVPGPVLTAPGAAPRI